MNGRMARKIAPSHSFNGKARRPGGAIKSFSRVKFENKRLGLGKSTAGKRLDPDSPEFREIAARFEKPP